MTSLRNSLFLAVTALACACGGSSPPDTTPRPSDAKVDIAIASVTLEDDCGTGPMTEPSDEPSAQLERKRAPSEAQGSMLAPGSIPSASMSGDTACVQSSIQLRVANTTGTASSIAIKKIELLDDSGAVVGELTSRAPSQWTGDAYEAWDQKVGGDQTLQISYALTAPDVARGESYTVRVTVAAGAGERTLEQRTTIEAPASLPPGAVT